MANLSDLKSSKFLKKEDVGEGMLVTIKALTKENVAKEGAEEEFKWTIWFEELDKPMVLNSTNGHAIANITGIDHDIEIGWVGKKVVLYDDPNVSYAGKITGGIRIRAQKSQTANPLPF